MRRLTMGLCWVGAFGVLLSAGCASDRGQTWNWPWSTKSALAEEYRVPPEDDSRYSDPQTFPKQVMRPTLARPESNDLRRPPGATGMPYRPSAMGNMIN